MARTRVLIVDDSAFMRHTLNRMLGAIPALDVVGAASDGEEGLRLARELRPDVITLDVEMAVLDGLAMLKRLMIETPTRVVMLSGRTTEPPPRTGRSTVDRPPDSTPCRARGLPGGIATRLGSPPDDSS
jgi:chemotaxis response regulator CheB